MRPPDPAFADPRQAALYDALDGARDDLELYRGLARECRAATVIDVGCGTGELALALANDGRDVTAVDPAAGMLAAARTKPGAERVRWIEGDVRDLPVDLAADLAVMTGNVAQVFVTDDDWRATLNSIRDALRPGGWLAFETRRPAARAWEAWDIQGAVVDLPSGGRAVVSRTVTDVTWPLVTFESTVEIGGEVLESSSTLRFRGRAEIEADLAAAGFAVLDVREAPDRPGLEDVYVAARL